jgi:hypothetical protein
LFGTSALPALWRLEPTEKRVSEKLLSTVVIYLRFTPMVTGRRGLNMRHLIANLLFFVAFCSVMLWPPEAAAQLNSSSFSPVVSYPTGGYPGQGIAVGDVNNDGFPDLVVVNKCFSNIPLDCHAGIGVLINNGDGTFQSPLRYETDQTHGRSVAIADVDGDGKPDLVVTNEASGPLGNAPSTVSVMRGNGDGTFQAAVSYLLTLSIDLGTMSIQASLAMTSWRRT